MVPDQKLPDADARKDEQGNVAANQIIEFVVLVVVVVGNVNSHVFHLILFCMQLSHCY